MIALASDKLKADPIEPMDIQTLKATESNSTNAFDRYLENPDSVFTSGNTDILKNDKLGFLCSTKCPGNLILKTYDFIQSLKETDIAVVSGFHSLIEKESLSFLLRSAQPVIICPARGIEGMRIPADWKGPLKEGRLLILSPFDKNIRRPTAEISYQRNKFVAAIADKILIAHASARSKTETFCKEILTWGKPILTFDSPHNSNLITLGAKPISPENVLE